MFRSTPRNCLLTLGLAATMVFVAPGRASGGATAAPSTREFMLALDAQIQRAKPREVFKRTIVFGDVRAGQPDGDVYPFTATVTIHDYNPGWPPDHYFGRTCITRIVSVRYELQRSRVREWVVAATQEIPKPICTDNPEEGKSIFPLDSLRGTRLGSSAPLPALMTRKLPNVTLKLGEYACTWPGGRLASQMRFRLNRNKTYTDLDGARGGTYTFDPFSTELRLHGGFLDKMGGKSIDYSTFSFSTTLTCGPWGG